MEHEQLTPSAFADKLQLGRAVVSHILNGRNNPSLDVVTRILSNMSNINPDWLLTGEGEMYKSKQEKNNEMKTEAPLFSSSSYHQNGQSQPDLFTQAPISPPVDRNESEYRRENIVEHPQIKEEVSENKTIIYQKAAERKVTKIIIYYSDNTFETFDANNKPL